MVTRISVGKRVRRVSVRREPILAHDAGMHFRTVALALLTSLAVTSARADEAPPEQAFARLRGLVGTWTATAASGKPIRVSYRLVAADSVLVETYTTASGKETLTLFALDGPRLLATHYCAQGNQPRLRLASEPTASPLVFVYLDATNLKSPQRSHLHRLELTLTDRDHFTMVEVYREDGKDDAASLRFDRVKPTNR